MDDDTAPDASDIENLGGEAALLNPGGLRRQKNHHNCRYFHYSRMSHVEALSAQTVICVYRL